MDEKRGTGETFGDRGVSGDAGVRPPRPEGLPDGVPMGDNGRLLIGDHGFILGNLSGDRVFPESRRNEIGAIAPSIPRCASGHYGEWLAACKGGPPAGSNFDWAGPLAETVLLGNVALRVQLRQELTGKRLLWDPVAFKITNSDKANAFLRRDYRPGWEF